MTHATALILKAIATGHVYGFDVMDATGLPSGTVYPALRRLERQGLIRPKWESDADAAAAGRPRRKLLKLTPDGEQAVARAQRRLAESFRLLGDLEVGLGGEGQS